MQKKMAGIVFLCIAGTAYAGDRLSSDELKTFYTNQTITGVHVKLDPGKTYFGADGLVHSESDAGKERIGRWWIDEDSDKRCVRWDNKNKDYCHYTERNDDGFHTLVHGKNGKRIVELKSVQEGNHL